MVYLVATPIGNMQDITFRAVETLRGVDEIFCEDTRHSLKLLNAYGIKKPLHSCHKFNERGAAERIIAAAQAGKNIAVISDAGMPVISDPGNILCAELKKAEIQYTVVPGANAFLSALILSALPADRFAFIGFLPDKAGEKKAVLEKYKNLEMTLCFHVAPQDVDRDISAMYSVFGERKACAVREITKLHEQAIPFNLSQGLAGEKRGEYVLIVEGAAAAENPLCSLTEKEHIASYMAQGMDKKDAVKQAAKDRGISKSEMYRFSIEL